jgi:hypothetical protein
MPCAMPKSSSNYGCFCNFHENIQSKQLPNGRKFAQYLWSPCIGVVKSALLCPRFPRKTVSIAATQFQSVNQCCHPSCKLSITPTMPSITKGHTRNPTTQLICLSKTTPMAQTAVVIVKAIYCELRNFL